MDRAAAATAVLLSTTDAAVWANQWERSIAEYPGIPTNRGTMLGWFANAIETGRTAGQSGILELQAENARLRQVIDTPHHVVVFDEHGWGLEHSLDCRLAKTMTTCEFNRAMKAFGRTIDDPTDLISRGPRWVLLGVDAGGMPSMEPER